MSRARPPAGDNCNDTSPSTPLLLHSDTASTLGPASSSDASSFRSTSPSRGQRQRAVAAARHLSFALAVLSSLCAGSITVFSLYGHIFQERLHYTQFQVNGLASAASIAMYIPVPFLGYLCDRVGPAPLSLLSAIFFSAGYGLAGGLYRRAEAEALRLEQRGSMAYVAMIVAFVFIGIGTSAMYLSAVATCAKNFGQGKHRGLALAIPIAAFGLSGMWLSQVGSRLLCERLADGSNGDVDVFRFFLFLAILLFVVGLLGTFGLRIVDERDLIDEAVEELERSGILDGSGLFGTSSRTYGTIEPVNLVDEEDAGILGPLKNPEEEEEARLKKQWALNAETRRFLTDHTMWFFALGFFFMIGPGEAFINNLGTVIKTLYPPTLHYVGKPTSAATHVSIVGITSTVVRLLTGTLTDLLAPSPQARHIQISSSVPMLQRMQFSVSRIAFLLFFAAVLSLGLASLASGMIQNHGERFWIVSGLIGAGYGAVFSLTPIIITVIWGVENFATNWGIVAMFPALGSTMWGLIYSAVYQAGARRSGPHEGGDEQDIFCYGVSCYAPTFWAMAASVWIACGLVFWADTQTDSWPGQTNKQTNNSSIVSKRSVEKLYYPHEPHYFRFFVKKFQRRSPLINKGYHLRMHVIDVLVRRFLQAPTAPLPLALAAGGRGLMGDDGGGGGGKKKKIKVVVNLGCGSDVLPWQCLSRYPDDCRVGDVKFVDVDFPDLIERKRQTVLGTPELLGALSMVREQREGTKVSGGDSEGEARVTPSPVVFDSDQYVQIGCDLRRLDTLQQALVSVVGDVADCKFLFVAEVSITYMETEGADEVIRWAASLGDAEFVLLEQILPDGEKHPFASTMLSHFQKLNTQLKSVHTYPTVDDQRQRFSSRGWDASVNVWTLWQAWADEMFLSPEDRRKLDEVEDFDEWEEFALFASHYCLVHAKTTAGGGGGDAKTVPGPTPLKSISLPVKPVDIQFSECPGQRGQWRFGAAMQLLSQGGGSNVLVNVMGLGTKCRLQSCDVYGQTNLEGPAGEAARELTFREGGPTTRMCHSLTELGSQQQHCYLLAGGRGSPSSPMKDCWLFDVDARSWKRTHDLPTPLHRHSVTGLGDSGLAFLVGGRGAAAAFDGYLVYHTELGWVSCEVVGTERPTDVYGAVLSSWSTELKTRFDGIYAGGLQDGIVADQILSWELDVSDIKKPTVQFTRLKAAGDASEGRLLARFGATCLRTGSGGTFVVLGGIAGDHLLDFQDEILVCSVSEGKIGVNHRLVNQHVLNGEVPRPLLVGTSAVAMPDGRIVILGGGATCFSMGTFWNKGVYSLQLPNIEQTKTESRWMHEKTIDIIAGEQRSVPLTQDDVKPGAENTVFQTEPIIRLKIGTQEDFAKILREGKPVVLEGLDLGNCVSAWNLEGLVDRVGRDRKVVVHESTTEVMDFNAKNFRYIKTQFEDFARRVGKGDRLYLRALSHERPTEKPAVFSEDFPSLAPDFVLPPQLSLVAENLFSSVLRISGPVNMWLHYDVMANVYCQVSGTKRLILFPPADVEHLSFAPGASSSSIDVFASLGSLDKAGTSMRQTHPHEAVLTQGDVLFLPPLWLHTTTPVSDSSVAVNVFFKDLDDGSYAPGRDVYGNRDLAAYEKGRQDVARVANSFRKLPAEARQFYLLRLADELRRKAMQ
ncbi:hypothetical protein B0H63DRAFT_412060 [Podospora didyma]|uniref:tRNA wybutosine-synthesizing protein 4 n=1 Tax=Podospora didyma TaxID=330526 RepID=A0AAE0NSL2_9PEZI|nr:hypothetical protein B0H63DRAFT_412060 [Podospora didyma]